MRNSLKNIFLFKILIIILRTFQSQCSLTKKVRCLASFLKDYISFKRLPKNENYKMKTSDLFPRIYDSTDGHKLDPIYFLQGAWCARKIFEAKPKQHYDIGSQALMVGIISQFTPTTMIDIRPLSIDLPGLSFVKGDIAKLPFPDSSIHSLSSICVIEHIGLGRYGDPLDPFGTEKAVTELVRVLEKGGSLYISVPVDVENKIYFNAHRAFRRNHVLEMFQSLVLIEEKYIYGSDIHSSYDQARGFGTGLYHFQKTV